MRQDVANGLITDVVTQMRPCIDRLPSRGCRSANLVLRVIDDRVTFVPGASSRATRRNRQAPYAWISDT